MTSRYSDYDDDGGDEDIEEWDRDDQDETYPCPYCGEYVYEDAERCPHCERYLSEEDAPSTAKPWWIVVGVIVVLLIVYWWSFGR